MRKQSHSRNWLAKEMKPLRKAPGRFKATLLHQVGINISVAHIDPCPQLTEVINEVETHLIQVQLLQLLNEPGFSPQVQLEYQFREDAV